MSIAAALWTELKTAFLSLMRGVEAVMQTATGLFNEHIEIHAYDAAIGDFSCH